MSSIRVVRLNCGHERYAPIDYIDGPLSCAECVSFATDSKAPMRNVVAATPDFDAMSRDERKRFMRELRSGTISGEEGSAS